VSAVQGATTDWAHTQHIAANEGERSMDINGTPGPGGIAQFIDVIPGGRYRLEFDLAGNARAFEKMPPDPEPPSPFIVTMEVNADGVTEQFEFTVDENTPEAPGWQRQTWEFNVPVDADDELLLQFLSRTNRLDDDLLVDFGPMIDNVATFLLSETHLWVGDGSWGDPTNWLQEGIPQGNWIAIVDNDLSGTDVMAIVDADSTVASVELLGTSGPMILEVLEGVTLTVTDGITVRPGGILKGKGTIVADIINNGGIVTAGLPEPSSGVLGGLALMGMVILARPRRR